MKVVIAMDSFKGSLASLEAGNAVREGILSICDADIILKPLADGGEGTVNALVHGMNGIIKEVTVTGPLHEKTVCEYGQLPMTNTAIIEMSAAAGLTLVAQPLRNPLNTTTFGVGELIKDAISDGYHKFIIGIGGSVTNDCGIGMLTALGFEFLDKNHTPVGVCGSSLSSIEYINTENILPQLKECTFQIACDVKNPLYGPSGAAFVYGPQKGASPEIVEILDQGLRHFSGKVTSIFGKDYSGIPGTGAAGGLGYGFLTFLNSSLESGIDIILRETDLEKDMAGAAFVITGEGMLDGQSAMGKATVGIAKMAKRQGAIVIAITGSTGTGAEKCNNAGIDAYFDIINTAMTLEQAMAAETASINLTQTTTQIFRLIKAITSSFPL